MDAQRRSPQRQRPLVEPLADLDTAIASVPLPPVPRRLRQKVEQTLAALAAKVPVRKTRRRRRVGRNNPAPAAPPRKLSPLQPLYPNHYWSSDITLLDRGWPFHLAALVDLYSRDVLAWEIFATQPTSERITALFEQAVLRFGKPRHFVSDQGGPFVGDALEAAFAKLGVGHREGAVGQHGSIAIVERLWRTAKESLDLRTARPTVSAILRERVAAVIDYYRTKRPHTTLGNATPHEVYHGIASRAHHPSPAPRGWHGEPSPPVPFVIRHAFPAERKLPYLERIA